MAPPAGSHALHRLNGEKHEKIFLSETIRPRAMIFGMQHHLVDCAPGVKNGLAPGVTYLTLAYIGKNIEKSSYLNP